MSTSRFSVAHATLSDQATLEDLLGYGPYVDSLDELLTHPTVATPFAVGVFGPWGTGKSSFMLQLRERFVERGLPAVWFQPWLFDEKEEVWKALILSILQYLQDNTEDNAQLKRIKSLVVGVGKIALNQAISRAIGLDITMEQVAQAYSNGSNDNTRFINTFRREFEQVKDAVLSNDERHSRLYVFVDDLDRCTPENCVRVLEAIRLFFDLKGCVFILGIDQEIVQKGIEIKYDRHIQMLGRDYLDKLIQLPFTLPPISEESFETFVRAITSSFEFQDQSRKLITLASERNPRRAKRLSNCLDLLRTAASKMAADGTVPESLSGPDAEPYLAFLLALQVRFPIANRWLVENLEHLSVERGLDESKMEELVTWLEGSYDRVTAEKIADEILAFVARAQRDNLVAKDWQGKETFVRITALVDTSSSEAESPKTLVIDSQYAVTAVTQGEEESKMDEGGSKTLLPVGDSNGEKAKRIDQLVGEATKSVDSLDGVCEPSLIDILFGISDRIFWRASEHVDIVVRTVVVLRRLDGAVVPIKAGIIADDLGQSKLTGLVHDLRGFGWVVFGFGTLLLLTTLVWSFWYYISLESIVGPFGGLLFMILLALSAALYVRGVLIILYGRRQLWNLKRRYGPESSP